MFLQLLVITDSIKVRFSKAHEPSDHMGHMQCFWAFLQNIW